MGWTAKKGEVDETGLQSKRGRMANLELLRIVSMLLVVALHYLDKGGILANLADTETPWVSFLPWFVEALAISAVNCYMLLTGYFLTFSSFKVSRIVRSVLHVWFYSVVIGVIAGCFGIFPEEGLCIHYVLSLVLPISMKHYWFMTAYVFMYLFTPFIASGAKKLNKKQLQIVIVLLLLVFAGIKSIAPIRLGADNKGYDCIWYLCVCIVGVYIRLYGIPFMKSAKKSFAVWMCACAAIFGMTMALRMVYICTGKLGEMLMVCYDYNHALTLAASLGMFGMFANLRLPDGRISKGILRIAPYTLGVYLLHEHLALRYRWQALLGAGSAASGLSLVVWLPVAMCTVFAAGVAVDMLCKLGGRCAHKVLQHVPPYRWLAEWLIHFDQEMAEEKRGGAVQGNKGRMVGFEWMRLFSMLLIVTAHYIGKGNLLPSLSNRELGWISYAPWLLEAVVILSINLYMMITGYFLAGTSFKLSRLVRTVLQVWFYSIAVGMVAGCFGLFPNEGLSGYYILELLFPVSMDQYWFMTAYVFMYLFTPFIAVAVRQLDKRQLQTVIVLLLFAFCILKSLVPGELETDMRGYDCIWYLCVCIIAVYIRLYGIPSIHSARAGFLWCLAGVAAITAETAALRWIYITTGKLESILTIGYSFNHVFALIAPVGAFVGFEKLRIKPSFLSSWLLKISPYILGVYLLHEHPAVRYKWQAWLGAEYAENGLWLIPWLILAVCTVFVAGIIVDVLRNSLFSGLHRILCHISLYRKLVDQIVRVDTQMVQAAENGGSDGKIGQWEESGR